MPNSSLDGRWVVKRATVNILRGRTPTLDNKEGGCVAIGDARWKMDNLVRQVMGEISQADRQVWLKRYTLSTSDIERAVTALLEDLEMLRVVFVANDGQWVLNVKRFRQWTRSPETVIAPRPRRVKPQRGKKTSRRPLAYFNQPQAHTVR